MVDHLRTSPDYSGVRLLWNIIVISVVARGGSLSRGWKSRLDGVHSIRAEYYPDCRQVPPAITMLKNQKAPKVCCAWAIY